VATKGRNPATADVAHLLEEEHEYAHLVAQLEAAPVLLQLHYSLRALLGNQQHWTNAGANEEEEQSLGRTATNWMRLLRER
jgi:hypothetical protein